MAVQDKINGKVRVQTDSGEWIVGEYLLTCHGGKSPIGFLHQSS